MSDDATEVPKPKRRGRPPKKRHDPADAPVNGNYSDDHVFNKEPGFVYFWASDEDIDKILNRGGVVCKRDSEQARPFFDRRKDVGEADIRVKNLTLMKIPEDLNLRAQQQAQAVAAQRISALRKQATAQVGNGQLAGISQHEYGRSIQ
jgi:hypothetical protein